MREGAAGWRRRWRSALLLLLVPCLVGAQRSCNLRQLAVLSNPTAARVDNDRFPRCETALSWPTDSTCHLNCSADNSNTWSHYQCRDGVWFSALLAGSLCPIYQAAGCQVSADGSQALCDACAAPVPENRLMQGLPSWPGAQLRHLAIRCHRLTRIVPNRLYVLPNLQTLDLAHNLMTSTGIDGFPFLESLTHLNLSYNRLSSMSLGSLPAAGILQSLDLRGNNITAVDAATFAATFTTNCNGPPVELLLDTSAACRCTVLPHDAPRACNAVNCSCASAEQEVRCGADGAMRIPASRVCDGKVDCDNCWDESFCQLKINIASLQLLPECLSPTVSFHTLRGRSTVFPADPDFIQRFCFGLPGFAQLRISFAFDSETRMRGIFFNDDTSAVVFEVYMVFLAGNIMRFLFSLEGGAASSATDFPLNLITCTSPQATPSGTSSNFPVLGAALVGALVFLVGVFGAVAIASRRRRRRLHDEAQQAVAVNRQLLQTALVHARQELAARFSRSSASGLAPDAAHPGARFLHHLSLSRPLGTADAFPGNRSAKLSFEVPFVGR
jgi:hypothetical protein